MSQSHKPLPHLPATTTTTTKANAPDQTRTSHVPILKEKLGEDMRAGLLSVEGRLQRSSLIRSFLADPEVRKDPWLYERRDSWAYALEDALDDFGRAMARGGWWKRVISGREAKAKMRLESTQTSPTSSSDAGSSTTKAAAVNDQPDNTQHSKHDGKPLPARPYDPLKILQHLAAHSKSSDAPGHLLVCLTPHGRSAPLPFEDSGFDIIPANIGCQFSPGSYSLQDEFKGSTVLFGMEELPASLLDAQDIPIQLIGGTFTFKGLIAPAQHALLATILRLSLYTHLNLLLEQHVLRDSGVQLDYRMPARRPTLSGPSSSTPPRVLTFSERARRQRLHEQDHHEPEDSIRHRPRATFLPTSLTNFLSHLAPSTSLPSNNGGLGLSSWAFGGKGKGSVQRSQTIGSPGDSLRRKEKAAKEAQTMTETKSLNPQSADTTISIPSDIVFSTSAPITSPTLPNEETKLTTHDIDDTTTTSNLPAMNGPSQPNSSDLNSKPVPPTPTSHPPPKFRRFSFMSPLPPSMSTTSTSGASASAEKKPLADRRHSIRKSVHAALGHLQMHAGQPSRHGHSGAPNPEQGSVAVQKQNGISGARSPMNQALQCINDSRGLLSTSIGVKFAPPRLVVELAQKETEFSAQNPPPPKSPIRSRSNSVPLQPTRKLKGDERAALTSLIGFGEDERNGSGLERRANEIQTSLEGVLSGMRGFVRFQGISVLWSEKVPCQKPSEFSTAKSSEIKEVKVDLTMTTNDTSNSTPAMFSPAGTLKSPEVSIHKPDLKDFLHCGKPEWRTWRFFVSDNDDAAQSSKPQWGDHSRSATSTSTNTNTNTTKSTTDSKLSKRNPSDTTNPPSTPSRPTHTLTQSQESNILRPHNSKPSVPDPRLGAFLLSLVQRRKDKCERPGCSYDQAQHILRAVHGGVGVEIWVREGEKELADIKSKEQADTVVETPGTESVETPQDLEAQAPDDVEKDDREVPVPADGPAVQIETVSDDKNSEKPPVPIVANPEAKSDADQGLFETWESCAVCGSKTMTRTFSEESSLFSFSKYLELLLYSPTICKLTPLLCSHTSLPTTDKSAANISPEVLSSIRCTIIRHFSHRSSNTQISFALSPVQDVYELHVPRLQIIRGSNSASGTNSTLPSRGPTRNLHQNNPILRGFVVQPPAQARKGGLNETSQKRILRKEIRNWWEGVADHIDQIENVLKQYEATHKVKEATMQEPSSSETEPERSLTPRPKTSKALPRLPSADSAYENFGSLEDEGDRFAEASGVSTPMPTVKRAQSPLSTSPSLSDHSRTPTGSTIFPSDNIQATVTTVASAVIAAPTPLNTPSAISTSTQNTSTSTASTVPPSIPPKDNSEVLLASLRYQMQTVEQNLYAQLARTPEAKLNDVRRSFLATARGTQKRLSAWKRKHLGDRAKEIGELGGSGVSKVTAKRGNSDIQSAKGKEKEKEGKGDEPDNKDDKANGTAQSEPTKDDANLSMEPEWWKPGCHVLPGGNIIVREDDWGSIIAYTLSTSDYQLELSNLSMVLNRAPSKTGVSSLPTTPPLESPGTLGPTSSSFFSIGTGYNFFGPSGKNQPDPDRDDVVWNEPEEYSAVISRKDNVRDPASILSIRGVLRHKVIAEVSSGTASPISQVAGSRKASTNSTTPSIMAKIQGHTATTPPPAASVKAKPDVSLDVAPAGGELETPEQLLSSDVAGQILSQAESAPPSAFAGTWRRTSRPPSITSFEEDMSQSNLSMGRVDTHIERRKGSSVISLESTASDKTIGKEAKEEVKKPLADPTQAGEAPPNSSTHTLPPPLPPKGDKEQAAASSVKATTTTPPDPPSNTSSSITSTLANGLHSAMRYVMNSEPVSRIITPPLTAAPSVKKPHSHHHGLLADISIIDDRPHIKYDWAVGKRLKFSCTVYYAKQFDTLRKRCGVSDTFLKSLSRSANWTADGGKSKSNFWKTSDDKFIIKTLVNAWNVADLQVLIDQAPSYFQYMDSTASKPTVLAKLMGFYTVEIRNLETGNVQSRADLLVMENLFFDRSISKTFDLKGIQGRKVKARGKESKTLFDGEWIEGQQRALTLIHPYSKVVLREAIKHDADFLARSNIMDYSLLVGVDEDTKQIACGLVDTIGSYTFAKTLEYKAKQNLQGGKEVTVIPPAEYRERFVNAMDSYFVACPDKWCKPLDHSQIISDPTLLPNIC